MKGLLLIALLLTCALSYSQGVFTVEGKKFGSNDRGFNYGFTISGSGILHEPGHHKTKGVTLGLGAGIHTFKDGDSPYFPVFAELGYIDKSKKVFPYINARGGYGFNDSETLKGGFYSEFRAGASFKVGVCRMSPFLGVTITQFRVKVRGETLSSNSEAIFAFGIAFVFAR